MSVEIYCDMDGVLVDFVGGVLKEHEDRTGEKLSHEQVKTWDFYTDLLVISKRRFYEYIEGWRFWTALQPLPWHQDLIWSIKRLMRPGDELKLITTLSPVSGCKEGKQIWLNRNTPFTAQVCLFSDDKSKNAAPNRILIDDKLGNCEEWRAAGGIAILFPQPWNVSNWRAGVDYCELVVNELRCCVARIREEQQQPEQQPVRAARANTGKPELSQLLHFRLEAVAAHTSAGRAKYPDVDGVPNWKLGGKPDQEYLDAAVRHLTSCVQGEVYDSETRTFHAAAVAWNMLAMLTLNYADLPCVQPVEANPGSQRGPASVAQIKAQVSQTVKELANP